MLEFSYGVSTTLMLLFYVPQLVKLLRSKSGSSDTSLLTWGVWSVCMAVNSLYAIEIVHDRMVILYSIGSMIACSLIFVLALVKQTRCGKAEA